VGEIDVQRKILIQSEKHQYQRFLKFVTIPSGTVNYY
jgi:hypothetical protein